jgi:glycerol-3-phosphate dehydrogenase
MDKNFSFDPRFPGRAEAFSALKKGVDVLVVGGGINGAGIFRDASLRNISAGLVEMNDFASGTSSRSSKLIHGGVRYLEHMDFGLVMESSLERTRLMRLLPDLIQPAPFLLPVFKDSPHGLFVMDLGLWLYDALAFFRNFHLHRVLNPREVLARFPELKQAGLRGGVLYYDCRVNDARLVINNIVSGCKNGGTAVNYAKVEKVVKADGKIVGAVVHDVLTGENHEIPCRVLVSAAGPWTNGFHKILEGVDGKILRLTKGIHLLFSQKRFKADMAAVITSRDDRRIVFVIPWEEYTLVGTTDTDFDGDPDAVFPDKSDVAYLLNLVNGFFPGLSLRAGDALSAFAGLRPLVLSGGSASSVSRKDKILKTASGAYLVGGGKLTTFRSISEKVVDRILRDLPLESRRRVGPCRTAACQLIDKPANMSGSRIGQALPARQDGSVLDYLFSRYGSGAMEVLKDAAKDPRLAERLDPALPFIFAEIPYGVRHEMLLSITDFFRLRTEIFLKSSDNGLSCLEEALSLLGKALCLGPEEIRKQRVEYQSFLKQNLNCLGKCSA